MKRTEKNWILRVERFESRDVPSISAIEQDHSALTNITTGEIETASVNTHGLIESDSSEGRIGRTLHAEARERFVIGSGPGVVAQVQVFDSPSNTSLGLLRPFDNDFTGGARVATAELTGDTVEDIIIASGPGALPRVEIFDGRTLDHVRGFLAYGDSFAGGVFVASGDVTGDGRADLITGAGASGGPHVRVFDGTELLRRDTEGRWLEPRSRNDYFAYSPEFLGGVSVGVGDLDQDGVCDVITGAGPGGGPHVRVFRGIDQQELASFFAYQQDMSRGVYVASGDVDIDGQTEIVTGPMTGGGPHVRVFKNQVVQADFCPFESTLRCGTSIAVADINGDGQAELITSTGPDATPLVKVLDGKTGNSILEFLPENPTFLGGLFVG